MKEFFVILGLGLTLTGCITIPLPKMSTPKKPETVYSWSEKRTREPKIVAIENGKAVVVDKEEKTLDVHYEKTTPKKTFIEKIGSWISGLSFFAFIAIAAGMILAPGATLGFLVKSIFKWKRAAKETFKAIKVARLEDSQALENSLKAEQSESTKKLVGQVKHSL